MDKTDLAKRVSNLIDTSVLDMQSGLWNYSVDDLEVLRAAQKACARCGEKTKATILARKIRKLEKEGV